MISSPTNNTTMSKHYSGMLQIIAIRTSIYTLNKPIKISDMIIIL